MELKNGLWALVLLVGCASSIPKDPEDPPQVSQQVYNFDLLGTTSMRIPEAPPWAGVPPQSRRIVVECDFQSLSPSAQDSKKQVRNNGYSDYGRRECQRLAGKLLPVKGAILLSSPTKTSERWVYRFEEVRANSSGLIENFARAPTNRMWGTLTRFEVGATKPSAHVFVTGEAQYFAGKVPPRADATPTKETLLEALMRALTTKALLNPNAGADLIED